MPGLIDPAVEILLDQLHQAGGCGDDLLGQRVVEVISHRIDGHHRAVVEHRLAQTVVEQRLVLAQPGTHQQGGIVGGQAGEVLAEAERIGTVEWIYFEGGEPFLYYPLMVEGLRLSKAAGFTTGLFSIPA